MKIRRVLPLLASTLAASAMWGCRSAPSEVPYAREFPAVGQQREVLDVQVFKRPTTIELVNTTNRAFGPCTLWLNQRFGYPIEGLGVGQTLTLRLKDFRDEHSEPFRDAGFFAVEIPDRLVLAQLEVPDPAAPESKILLGLIVIGEEP